MKTTDEKIDELAAMIAREFTEIHEELALCIHREDLDDFAKKEDLVDFATKEDLKGFAREESLSQFATKEDFERFATKEDMLMMQKSIEFKFDTTIGLLRSDHKNLERRVSNLEMKIA